MFLAAPNHQCVGLVRNDGGVSEPAENCMSKTQNRDYRAASLNDLFVGHHNEGLKTAFLDTFVPGMRLATGMSILLGGGGRLMRNSEGKWTIDADATGGKSTLCSFSGEPSIKKMPLSLEIKLLHFVRH